MLSFETNVLLLLDTTGLHRPIRVMSFGIFPRVEGEKICGERHWIILKAHYIAWFKVEEIISYY
jgi:hypothetical protein